MQTEALAHLRYGEQGDALRALNDDLQDTVCFLLSDLSGEVSLFQHKADMERLPDVGRICNWISSDAFGP